MTMVKGFEEISYDEMMEVDGGWDLWQAIVGTAIAVIGIVVVIAAAPIAAFIGVAAITAEAIAIGGSIITAIGACIATDGKLILPIKQPSGN